MAVPRMAAANADDERPAELGDGRGTEMRNVGDGQGEGSESGEAVEADEDERADPGGQQSGHEDQVEFGAGDAGHLHEQEGAHDRRSEQGGDRREAPGGADHQGGLLRGVLLEQIGAAGWRSRCR